MRIINRLGSGLVTFLVISLFISFLHLLTAKFKPCNTKGKYFLPVTYILCKLSEPIDK